MYEIELDSMGEIRLFTLSFYLNHCSFCVIIIAC